MPFSFQNLAALEFVEECCVDTCTSNLHPSFFANIIIDGLATIIACTPIESKVFKYSSIPSNVPPQGGRKHPEQQFVQVDTRNILFICGGAFDGIEKKIAQRLNTRAMGYGRMNADSVDRNNLMQYLMPQDLRSFGLIPELVGRLPVLTYMEPLGREALRSILTQPKNAIIKQYEKLFEMDGVKLVFDDEVLDYIVDKAIEYRLGARGLRSICEAIMMDTMFDIPSSGERRFEVTLPYAREKFEKKKFLALKQVG